MYNLAFGEKLFEEADIVWKKLFLEGSRQTLSSTIIGDAINPESGGRKMIRLTRVLLAALLSHAKSETISSIHKQIFIQRSQLLQIIQSSNPSDMQSTVTTPRSDITENSLNPFASLSSVSTVMDVGPNTTADSTNETNNEQNNIHPFFNQQRTRRISERSDANTNDPSTKDRFQRFLFMWVSDVRGYDS